jgi:protein-cysteine N-palmitoyltransferase HHAT
MTDRQRKDTPHSNEVYSFLNYLSYVLYSPLYIGGPIITFNDFMWQVCLLFLLPLTGLVLKDGQFQKPVSISRTSLLGYAIRFIVCFMTMEFILHFMYVVAIKDTKAWMGDTPAEIAMIGFWNLIIVWLKVQRPLHAIWRMTDYLTPALNTMALFQTMGAGRRCRPAREHGPMHGEQLLSLGLLACLAPEL